MNMETEDHFAVGVGLASTDLNACAASAGRAARVKESPIRLVHAWGPDKSRVSAYWPHGLLCLSCHCVGWVFPLNLGEPKCVGAKKLIREPPQSNHIHPSKRTNVV